MVVGCFFFFFFFFGGGGGGRAVDVLHVLDSGSRVDRGIDTVELGTAQEPHYETGHPFLGLAFLIRATLNQNKQKKSKGYHWATK